MCEKCRFCCFGRSTSVIIAAVYTLIESCLFLAAATAALLVHKCTIFMDANRYLYSFYLVYFRSPCGKVDLSKLGINLPVETPPLFKDGLTEPVDHTLLFTWIYIGFNGFWILASLMLLIGGIRSCSGRFGHYFFWLPWIFATMGNIVLDVVVAIYYGKDLRHASSLDRFLQWIGLLNFDVIEEFIPVYESQVMSIPTYIMIGVSLRGILFELINIFYLIVVTFIWFEILNEFVVEKPRDIIRAYETQHAIENPAYVSDPYDRNSIQSGSTGSVGKPQLLTNGNRFIKNNENRVVERDDDVERRLKKYQTTTSVTSPENNYGQIRLRRSQSADRNHRAAAVPVQQPKIPLQPSAPHEPHPDYYVVADSSQQLPGIPAPDYDYEDDEDITRNKVARTTSNVQALRQTFERAAENPRERSASPATVVADSGDDRHVSRNSSFVNRPELRNQLPWSYFSKQGDEAVPPVKTFVHPITGERMVRTTLAPVLDSNSPPETFSEPPSDNEGKSQF